MPNLKRVVDDLESVSEKYRVLYTEKDGKHHLDPEFGLEGFISASEVKGLRDNKDEILAEMKKYKALFDGIDPEKYRDMESQIAKLGSDKDRKKGDFEALERQLNEKHAKEIEVLTGKVDSRGSTIQRLMVDNVATQALAAEKGNVKLLLPHVKSACRCVQDDEGEWNVEVLDGDGRPRISSGKASKLMSISELVGEMKDDDGFAAGFEGNGATGGGSAGSHRGGSGGVVLRGDDRKDPAKYQAAKAAADKAGVELQLLE